MFVPIICTLFYGCLNTDLLWIAVESLVRHAWTNVSTMRMSVEWNGFVDLVKKACVFLFGKGLHVGALFCLCCDRLIMPWTYKERERCAADRGLSIMCVVYIHSITQTHKTQKQLASFPKCIINPSTASTHVIQDHTPRVHAHFPNKKQAFFTKSTKPFHYHRHSHC